MFETYMGFIFLFAGDYAPRDFAICDGAILDINTNMPLYSILRTTYGGDGKNTFALPDLRSSAPKGSTYLICTGGVYPAHQ